MKFTSWMIIAVIAISLFSTPRISIAGVNGTTRGVTFYYLDGSPNPYTNPPFTGEGFMWVLNNQYDPTVRARIGNLLAQYRDAGVNWIRLVISSNNFASADNMEPVPSTEWIKKLNDFLAITRSGENAGQFTIEIVLIPKRTTDGYIADTPPYDHDKLWLKTWIDHINYTNVGMIMLGGDLSPCLLSGCDGAINAKPITINHGEWIKSIWAWKEANYPKLNASYEVIGVQSGSNNDPRLISMLAHWNDQYTPSNPNLAASLYISLPPGSTWQQYASAMSSILDSYLIASSKSLRIDEYGKFRGTNESGVTWTLQDQEAAYLGTLGAVECWRQHNYGKFAWVGGRDYPYDTDASGRAYWGGLVDSFNGNQPVMSPTWDDLKLYYTLQKCP